MSSGSGAVVVSIDNTAEAQAPIDNDDFADPNRISMKKVNGNPTVASASNRNQEGSNSNSNVNDETNTASSISSPSQPGSNEVAIDIGKRKEMDAKQLKEMIEQSTKQEFTGANNKDRFLKKDLENPFVYHDAGENSFLIRCYENFKYYLIGPFILIPIRFSLSLAVLIISVIITYIALVHSWFLKDGIESSKMQFYRSIIVFNLRVIYFIIGFYWVSVKGKPCSTKEARLAVIAPHQTAVDAFYIVYAYGFPAFVGKKEALHYPFLGTLMKLSGGVFFSREDRDAKDGAIEAIKKKASAGNDRHFLIFPTGTCTSPTCLICFKRGAFMPGEPLQPVLLRFKYTFFNPTWSSAGPNRLWMIYRLCCQFYNRLEVEFMPVYHPSAEEKANAFLYANNVRKLMADSLGVPTTEHSYDDMFLAKEARRLRVPVGQVLPFEFHEIKKLLEINLSDAKQLMRRFFSVKSFDHQTGKVSQEQFAKILGIPLTQPVIDIFNIFDDTGSGYIDFPSFLIGLAILRKNSLKSKETKAGDNMDTIKFIFDVIDRENKGVISKEQFVEMFGSFFAKYDRRKILEIFKDKKSINFDEFKSHMFQHPEFFLVTLNLASRSDKDDKNLKSSKRLSVLTRQLENVD